MSLVPLIPRSHERTNRFAQIPAIAAVFRRAFSPYILPDKLTYPRFDHASIFGELYHPVRTWVDGAALPARDENFRHEEYLDYLFWTNEPNYRKIFLLGEVGCGKSTLIDYYLRCYCPSQSEHAAEFARKLVISFEASEIQSTDDYSYHYFLDAQATLRTECEKRGFDLDGAIKHRHMSPGSVREWVTAAMEVLSLASRSSNAATPFQYIVVVIDNLDQCPVEVQRRAISDVDRWLRLPTMNIWRAFIPLWPRTLNKLRFGALGPKRTGVEFRIGTLPSRSLLRDRLAAARREFQKLGKDPPFQEVRDYLRDTLDLAEERLMPRVDALCGGNLRRYLSLWETYLTGEAGFSLWRRVSNSHDQQRRYDYELLDVLLCGNHSNFVSNNEHLPNVFAVGLSGAQRRELLIGLHSLHLLGTQQNSQSRDYFFTSLFRLGYDTDAIKAVFRTWHMFNAYHEDAAGRAQETVVEYHPHHEVIEAYFDLFMEPAYIDNVAQITPIERALLPRMRATRGDNEGDFMDRVNTSLVFLEFLQISELTFAEMADIGESESRELGRVYLNEYQLPQFWKRAALRYKRRLDGLRRSDFLRNVPEQWWEDTLKHHLFECAEQASDTLQAEVGSGDP